MCATLLYPQPRPCLCAAVQHTQGGLGAVWDLGWREEGDCEQQSVIRRREMMFEVMLPLARLDSKCHGRCRSGPELGRRTP